MRHVIIFISMIFSLTLFSFKNFSGDKVILLANGNYDVPTGIISEGDAKTLFEMSITGVGETTVAHTKIYAEKKNATFAGETSFVQQSIWQHTDISLLNQNTPYTTYTQVQNVMSKYLQ